SGPLGIIGLPALKVLGPKRPPPSPKPRASAASATSSTPSAAASAATEQTADSRSQARMLDLRYAPGDFFHYGGVQAATAVDGRSAIRTAASRLLLRGDEFHDPGFTLHALQEF